MTLSFVFSVLLIASGFVAVVDGAVSTGVEPSGEPNGDDEGCTPPIADTCFLDVEDDLRKIFDSTNNYAQARNASMLRDLCSAWNDSLSCTADIIDSGCLLVDGRAKFDHWNAALRQTLQHVCSDEFRVLNDLFQGIKCLNISSLLYCVETTAQLKTVQDLLKTDLDVKECWYLKKVIQKCGEYVTLETCAEEVMEPFLDIVNKFFEVADCTSGVAAIGTSMVTTGTMLVYITAFTLAQNFF